jgi:2,3-bisphosphoglycerate-dependent phosphoglycerate mutase
MKTLVLLRHGESTWNLENRFTGWEDVDLTPKGVQEAHEAARLLAEGKYTFDLCFTSLLKRAIRTLWIALDDMDLMWLPQHRSWRLNERHYGALQGKDKKQTLAEFGEEQFMLWRRSYDTPPPPIEAVSEFSQDGDPRYADLGDAMPATECLADVVKRFLPYYEESVVPDIRSGQVVLLAAHGKMAVHRVCTKV